VLRAFALLGFDVIREREHIALSRTKPDGSVKNGNCPRGVTAAGGSHTTWMHTPNVSTTSGPPVEATLANLIRAVVLAHLVGE